MKKIDVNREISVYWDGFRWVDEYTGECFTDEEFSEYVEERKIIDKLMWEDFKKYL